MAAQPPRPPPNNLLFCGPPPALPHVVLLPSDASRDVTFLQPLSDTAFDQTNDARTLHEINNVGVPTYGGLFSDHVGNEVVESDLPGEEQFPSDNYLRRNRSFDMADIYAARIKNDLNAQAFRHRRSVPDLSKVELVFEVDCGPIQPPPLVLNNPFYDGSYALDPAQLNQTMVVLPDNYLAFEDSFVPWNYKPELVVEAEINPELYYDGLPLIPSNDPWSAYGSENAAFEYYSPQFVTPIGEQDGIHYMPLADFEYAIPQYMSLPTIEQANVETFIDNNSQSEETATPVTEVGRKNEDASKSLPEIVTSSIPSAISSNTVSEDEKVSAIDSSTKESSIQSEESLNADISNDVTSSLAFVPCSKSSQLPHDADDTSEDTSPCSTDYQEASALDIVQSLDELSCCDSIDFSQSKDDSPIFSDPLKSDVVVKSEVGKYQNESDKPRVITSNKALANIPLSKLPSIPIQDKLPTKLPPASSSLLNKEIYSSSTSPNVQLVPLKGQVVNASELVITENEAIQTKVSDIPSETQVIDNTVTVTKPDVSRIAMPPHPPAVPPAWLAPRTQNCDQTTSFEAATPQICVENSEGQPVEFEKSPKPPSQPGRTNQPLAVEPVPSCSFVPPQVPSQASQLKPKEVEVSC